MNSESRWTSPGADALIPTGIAGSAPTNIGRARTPYEVLLQTVERHIEGEKRVLPLYRELAESTKDGVIRLIMNIVLEDEARHHELMRRVASQLRDDLDWSHNESGLPMTRDEEVDTDAHETLRRFVAAERQAAQELRSLAKDANGIYGDLLFELLTMMALDSEKHEHLLRFLFRHVGTAIAQEKSASE